MAQPTFSQLERRTIVARNRLDAFQEKYKKVIDRYLELVQDFAHATQQENKAFLQENKNSNDHYTTIT